MNEKVNVIERFNTAIGSIKLNEQEVIIELKEINEPSKKLYYWYDKYYKPFFNNIINDLNLSSAELEWINVYQSNKYYGSNVETQNHFCIPNKVWDECFIGCIKEPSFLFQEMNYQSELYLDAQLVEKKWLKKPTDSRTIEGELARQQRFIDEAQFLEKDGRIFINERLGTQKVEGIDQEHLFNLIQYLRFEKDFYQNTSIIDDSYYPIEVYAEYVLLRQRLQKRLKELVFEELEGNSKEKRAIEERFHQSESERKRVSKSLAQIFPSEHSEIIIEAIKKKYKGIKGVQMKRLFEALKICEAIPGITKKLSFHNACKKEFNWDIASYNAMNDQKELNDIDKEEINEMVKYFNTII